MKNNVFLITNESIFIKEGGFYCDNIDIKSIPESLSDEFNISILARSSKVLRSKRIEIKNIIPCANIFTFIIHLVKSFDNSKNIYITVSISPYTFISSLVLGLFRKKNFTYLRSDGYEEYKTILGFFGPTIYNFMFTIVAKISLLISCRKHILKGRKGNIVHPSQLNEKWFSSIKKLDLSKINLLYVGRVKVEKGIFSLIEMIKNKNIKLTIVTSEKKTSIKSLPSNISLINFDNYNDSIIEIYDKYNIFILPSFTEGHPQVLDEALARNRPVIVFEEISHVVRDRKGVFVSKRNIDSLIDTIKNIKNNFEVIQEDIKKNSLPTKKTFINEVKEIILNN
jgi:glycosyltransferase involved in cell wall biosynthesis